MKDQLYEVLLVEDNHDDVFFMRRVVKKAAMPWNLTVVMDGQTAIEYVEKIAKFTVPLPSLVFLDLKLPYASGFEVLASIRSHQQLLTIPVVILTSSPEERDEQRAMELGARGYRVKPPTEEMLRNIAGSIRHSTGNSVANELL